jgi:hypothetical protein
VFVGPSLDECREAALPRPCIGHRVGQLYLGRDHFPTTTTGPEAGNGEGPRAGCTVSNARSRCSAAAYTVSNHVVLLSLHGKEEGEGRRGLGGGGGLT